MAKHWKLIRASIANANDPGLHPNDITVTGMDADGTVYWTDQNGDAVKVLYPSTTPVVVDSDTATLTIATSYLAGVSAYTYQYAITNENSLDVTAECTFTHDGTVVSTGATIGLLTATASGTTTVNIIHNDGPSGTSSVTVGQYNSLIAPSGGTLDTNGNGEFQITASTDYYLTTGATIQNQEGILVTLSTADVEYTVDAGTAVAYGIPFNVAATGETILVIRDANATTLSVSTGATYTVTVV